MCLNFARSRISKRKAGRLAEALRAIVEFDLSELEKRIHILEGLEKVFDALDEQTVVVPGTGTLDIVVLSRTFDNAQRVASHVDGRAADGDRCGASDPRSFPAPRTCRQAARAAREGGCPGRAVVNASTLEPRR